MFGINTISAISFTLPRNAIHTIVAPIISVPVSPGKILAGYLLKYKNASNAPSILIDIIVTSYFPNRIQAIVRDVIEITPKPDSIPFKPASMFVRLDPIERAMGIEIKYNIPTLGGAAHIRGRPAMKSKKNLDLDESASKSSKIPIIPTSNITSRTITNVNARISCIYIPENIPITNPNIIPKPPISATTGFHDL